MIPLINTEKFQVTEKYLVSYIFSSSFFGLPRPPKSNEYHGSVLLDKRIIHHEHCNIINFLAQCTTLCYYYSCSKDTPHSQVTTMSYLHNNKFVVQLYCKQQSLQIELTMKLLL